MVNQVARIDMIGTEYVALYHGKEISRGKSIVKVSMALAKYIKGQ